MMGGSSAEEEIGKNWPNLPPSATRAEHVGDLANVSLIFATQLLLHQTVSVRQVFNHGVLISPIFLEMSQQWIR